MEKIGFRKGDENMDKPSKRFQLNETDWKNAANSALVFLAPSLISLVIVLTPQVEALVPDTTNRLILLAIIKWGSDQLLGILRRYEAGK